MSVCRREVADVRRVSTLITVGLALVVRIHTHTHASFLDRMTFGPSNSRCAFKFAVWWYGQYELLDSQLLDTRVSEHALVLNTAGWPEVQSIGFELSNSAAVLYQSKHCMSLLALLR